MRPAVGLPPILSPGNDLGWDFADENFSGQLQTDEPAEARAARRDFRAVPVEELVRRGAAAREWVRCNLSLDRLGARLNSLVPTKSVAAGRLDSTGKFAR